MKLYDYLRSDRIFFLKKSKKNAAIRELVELTCAAVPVLEGETTLQTVQDRIS